MVDIEAFNIAGVVQYSMGKTCQLQVRRLAGVMTILGLTLGIVVSQWFFLLIGFVGANLLQSSFTDVCPAEELLPGCETSDEEGSAVAVK
ncbi:MAG: protein of unknown function (DUF2892) [halophilic archaeon J07HX5]|nr:MAG: protein of unknown function (DUF2892) [halophilic archaeon J07HX5]